MTDFYHMPGLTVEAIAAAMCQAKEPCRYRSVTQLVDCDDAESKADGCEGCSALTR